MEDRPHAGAHHLGIVGIDAARAEQAAQAAKPGQRAQNGAEIARVLNFVQIDGAFAGGDRRGALQHRHHSDDALRRLGVGDLRHLPLADHLGLERALPLFMSLGDIQLAALQQRVVLRRLLQLQHQMLAFHQEVAELGAVLLLLQLLDVVELHQWHARIDLATASATLMPSTPAERMPPA